MSVNFVWGQLRQCVYRRSVALIFAYHYCHFYFEFPTDFCACPHTRSERVNLFTFALRRFTSELWTDTFQVFHELNISMRIMKFDEVKLEIFFCFQIKTSRLFMNDIRVARHVITWDFGSAFWLVSYIHEESFSWIAFVYF